MCVYASRAVWNNSKSRGSSRLVLLCIADHVNTESGTAYPSLDTIAEETCVSRRQVSRAIADLEAMGEIEVLHKGNGRGYSTVYRILLDTERPKKDDKCDIKDDTMPSFGEETACQKDDICDVKDDMVSVKDDTMSSQSLRTIINQEKEREFSPPPIVNGIPLIETEPPEFPQADKIDVEMWAAELGQLVREDYHPLSGMGRHQQKAVEFRQVANWLITTYPDLSLEQFKAKWLAYWSQTGLGGKPWLSQIQDLAGEAIRYELGNEPQKTSKSQMAEEIWREVDNACSYRDSYSRAKERLNGRFKYIDAMGGWEEASKMKPEQFKFKFYEIFEQVQHAR